MQPLSAQMSNPLFLPHLCNLECNHYPIYFREKEMQNQRHEVCLSYKRIGVFEYWSVGVMEIAELSFGLPPYGRVPSFGLRIADLRRNRA
jgi:hypothetical protein